MWSWSAWLASIPMPSCNCREQGFSLVCCLCLIIWWGVKTISTDFIISGCTNDLPSRCLPSQLCLGQQKCSTSVRQKSILKIVLEKCFHLHFCSISLYFCIPERYRGPQWSSPWNEGREQAPEAEECLNDQKERTLWEWNKSSQQGRNRSELLIPLILGSLLSVTSQIPSFQSWVNNLVANTWSPLGSWGNTQDLTSAQICACCSWQVVGLHCKEKNSESIWLLLYNLSTCHV